MEKKPYHHLPDGTFRNPEGSPLRTSKAKFSYTQFIKLKKKIDMTVPKEHVVAKEKVLSDLEKYKNEDYIAWIGHATYLIKLGDTTIITDPVFSKNAGPLIFGPDRFTEPALNLDEIPKTGLLLLTHNHYDHQDMGTIRKYPFKDTKVLTPLNLGKYFTKNKFKDVNEMDWYEEIQVNDDLKVTLLPAVHWSKRSLTDMNKTLWGNFLIEYKGKKILFACDTGYGNIYKELGEKYGPIDLTMINIGAYDFKPMFDKSIYHTTPEEALNVAQDLKSKKVMGTHWGTFVLSLEPIMEPPMRFKASAEKYGFKKEDAIIFKIESHNHPSFIEPYQGAATGVGGIMRDVFTMGARPVANLNALRFGAPDHPKTRHLVAGVVSGIGGYGNCMGVPTVGGEINFDPSYNGNNLVNAMCVGVARTDKIFYAAATGIGSPVVYVGSKTGRDGIHGATFSSAEVEHGHSCCHLLIV